MPGTVTVLEYNGSRYEDPFEGPINGLEGKSVTHSAALMRDLEPNEITPNQLIRLKKLHQAGKLDFRENVNAQGKKTYQIYYSYWPKKNWDPISSSSRLETMEHDQTMARLGGEFAYSPEAREYLQPPSATFASPISILRYFIPTRKYTVPPSIMMNLTGFYAKYPEEKFPGFKSAVIAYGEKFAKLSEVSLGNDSAAIEKAKTVLESSKAELFNAMFPNTAMDNDKFSAAIEPFVSFGLPAKDTVSLPLITNPNAGNGLLIAPMIDHILDHAEHPEHYKYNLAFNNCANEVLALLQSGIPKGASNRFKMALGVVPGIGIGMHPPITLPGRVLRMVIDARHVLTHADLHKQKTNHHLKAYHGLPKPTPENSDHHHHDNKNKHSTKFRPS